MLLLRHCRNQPASIWLIQRIGRTRKSAPYAPSECMSWTATGGRSYQRPSSPRKRESISAQHGRRMRRARRYYAIKSRRGPVPFGRGRSVTCPNGFIVEAMDRGGCEPPPTGSSWADTQDVLRYYTRRSAPTRDRHPGAEPAPAKTWGRDPSGYLGEQKGTVRAMHPQDRPSNCPRFA